MGELQSVPWLVAFATGAWCCVVAWRSRQSRVFWVIGGAVYALIVSTMVIGLFQAAFIPLRESAATWLAVKAIGISVLLIGIPGGFVTWQLWREDPPEPTSGPTSSPGGTKV